MKNEQAANKYKYSFDFIQKKLEGKKDSYGMLMKEIVRTGICTECGTCASVCEALEWDHDIGQPKLVGKCTGCGICYNQCPRTITDPVQLIGTFKTGYTTTTNIPEVIGGQDGGTVTSLLCYLFDEHLIDAAVVTMKDPNKPWHPISKVITSKNEAIQASGSIYAHSQTVDALMDAVRSDYRSLAFVGTPCNIDAVYKMTNSPLGMLKYFMRAHILTIGLFCMDSFSPETLYPMFESEGIEINKVKKMNITKGKLNLFYEGKEEPVKSYPVRSLHKFRSSSCSFCTDLTSENADISVGSVGSADKTNTVFARSSIGVEIIEDAAKKGFLKIEPYTSINLEAVLNLAKLKKVSKYTIQKRKVFIVRDVEEKEARIETKPVSEKAKQIIGLRKPISVDQKIDEKSKKLDLTITNSAGFTLENIKIRVAAINEMFESKPWITSISELFPFESVEIGYIVDNVEGNVLVEASSDVYGKFFSKTIKYSPKK